MPVSYWYDDQETLSEYSIIPLNLESYSISQFLLDSQPDRYGGFLIIIHSIAQSTLARISLNFIQYMTFKGFFCEINNYDYFELSAKLEHNFPSNTGVGNKISTIKMEC